MLMPSFSLFGKDVAMDLGTVNTLIYVKGRGVVLDEPSMITLNRKTGKVVAVGAEAKNFSGRHGNEFVTCRPLRSGVVSDFDAASSMIRLFLIKVFKRIPFVRPRLIAALPTSVSTAEKRALIEAAEKAGAGKVYLIHEPVAAALGTGLRVDQAFGHMIVDIGGGSTEIAVVCKHSVSCSESLRIAGDEINAAICQYIRQVHHIDISETMAEMVKTKIGSIVPSQEQLSVNVQGKEISTGMPKIIAITSDDVQQAVRKPAGAIVSAVKRVIEQASPDLASDIAEDGIWLTGGGALLKGWGRFFREQAGIEAQISQDPLRSTIRGIGIVTEQFSSFKNIVFNGKPASVGVLF